MEPEIGSILEGKVNTITKFGAFVTLDGGKSGLVHISEIANTYVNDVREFLQRGPCVDCKAEQMCNIPCGNYWKWWDMRMEYMKRRLGCRNT